MAPTLITNARVFDGASITFERGHVLLESGRIKQISAEPISPPAGCDIIDSDGCTLIPGLIDAHAHVFQDLAFLKTAIRYGITTVLDMHNEPEWFHQMKAMADTRSDVSDIHSVCLAATIKDGWPGAIVRLSSANDPTVEGRIANWPNITDAQAAEEYVARTKDCGARFIKIMQEDGHGLKLPFPTPLPTPSLEIQKALVDSAHRHGMLAVAHAMTNESTLKVLHAGVDGLMHTSIEPINDAIIEAFKERNAFLVPTLAVHASATGQDKETRERFAQELKDSTQKQHFLGCLHLTQDAIALTDSYEQVRCLKEAGVDIVCGTDSSTHLPGTLAGASVHHELWLYVNRCGFTPSEALVSATSKAAERFGLAGRGKIEEGYWADLMLVEGNPTESIDVLGQIQGVWRNGVRVVGTSDRD